jgi:hypothetical protein
MKKGRKRSENNQIENTIENKRRKLKKSFCETSHSFGLQKKLGMISRTNFCLKNPV